MLILCFNYNENMVTQKLGIMFYGFINDLNDKK